MIKSMKFKMPTYVRFIQFIFICLSFSSSANLYRDKILSISQIQRARVPYK